MSERDKVNEAIKQCAKLLGAEGVEAMVVAATKGTSAYRISNLHDDATVKSFVEYMFGVEEKSSLVRAEVYHAHDGKLDLLGATSDELN